MVLNDQSLNVVEFGAGEAGARLQSNRLQPELGFAGVTLDMNERRLVPVAGIEEKAVWTRSKNSRHRAKILKSKHEKQETREWRLDFMAALLAGAASSGRRSGVLEGVAKSRVARNKPCLAAGAGSPPERRHQ